MFNWLKRLLSAKDVKTTATTTSTQPGVAALKIHGDAQLDMGEWQAAADFYRQALAIAPDHAGIQNNLGLALSKLRQYEAARDALRRALAIDPQSANACYTLGSIAQELGDLDEAAVRLTEAVTIEPNFAAGFAFLGNVYRELGRTGQAIAACRRALELDPGQSETHSVLLMTLQGSEELSQAAMFAEHRSFAERFETPLLLHRRVHTNAAEPGKRIKLGYVSPDFRRHSVAHFMLPVIEHHDRQQFEIYCYYNRPDGDEYTQRFVESADHFLSCASMSDEDLAERIRADGIDILVDLAGHTGGNRLPVFARKPAPVQVTYLGYIDTTGLAAMDYRLTNGDADPPGNEAFYSEKLFRLPRLWWTFRPAPDLPEVVPLPAALNGYITFCSTNQIAKISEGTIAAWAEILLAVPGSHLALMGIPSDGAMAHLAQRFAARNIGTERLEFHRFTTLDHFRRVVANADISLDTFPYNGGTTTCETLWLGVPCVALTGKGFASRMSYALLKEIGLPQLAGETHEAYVGIAVELARDLGRLKQLRTGMRERLGASSLGDEAGFTCALEQAYRNMWTAHVDRAHSGSGRAA
ncbi:MAG TPA: tetratricopeptide repeat protein [Burkholderiaceae bacterium]|jgi:predicted O-linked N-acetylglucosamine transferase (SPINDLY family)